MKTWLDEHLIKVKAWCSRHDTKQSYSKCSSMGMSCKAALWESTEPFSDMETVTLLPASSISEINGFWHKLWDQIRILSLWNDVQKYSLWSYFTVCDTVNKNLCMKNSSQSSLPSQNVFRFLLLQSDVWASDVQSLTLESCFHIDTAEGGKSFSVLISSLMRQITSSICDVTTSLEPIVVQYKPDIIHW